MPDAIWLSFGWFASRRLVGPDQFDGFDFPAAASDGGLCGGRFLFGGFPVADLLLPGFACFCVLIAGSRAIGFLCVQFIERQIPVVDLEVMRERLVIMRRPPAPHASFRTFL